MKFEKCGGYRNWVNVKIKIREIFVFWDKCKIMRNE